MGIRLPSWNADPFNTETSISPEESNYYGHYPYEIEDNYFSQGVLTTNPGQYRQTTVELDSFAPNAFGLYNMHAAPTAAGGSGRASPLSPSWPPMSKWGEGLSVHYSGGSGLPDDVAQWLLANKIKTE